MKHGAEIVALLFLSRDQAHRAHLTTDSYSRHMALGQFYASVIDLADTFAEAYQGLYGPFTDIPVMAPNKGAIDQVLEDQLADLVRYRSKDVKPIDSPLLNILDEVAALYLQTLYRLRRLV